MKWLPLEGNPDVFSKYMKDLGGPPKLEFVDVIGFDEELINMTPPSLALIFAFPLTEKFEAVRKSESEKVKAAGLTVSDKVWFTKQTIKNACGTIALLHAMANLPSTMSEFEKDGFFESFFKKTEKMTASERGKALESDKIIEAKHQGAQQGGQSAIPQDGDVEEHFVCFVVREGHLYELDGRCEEPINHGPSSLSTILTDTGKLIQKLTQAAPDELRFSMMALAQN
eukprot:Platyproteum_vivax@DN8789_c0_g1_i1.p1